MSQRDQRTDRTVETRSAPSRGPAPAGRTALLDVQRTLGNTAALHLLRQAGHPYAGTERAGNVPVQRFMEPVAGDDAATWRREALTHVQTRAKDILLAYAALTKRAVGKVPADMGIQDAWMVAWKASKNPAVAGEEVDTSLTAVLRQLNIMEQEQLTSAVVGETVNSGLPLPTSKAGTEFTFTDSTLDGTAEGRTALAVDVENRKRKGAKDNGAKAAITYAERKITEWADRVMAAPAPAGFTVSRDDGDGERVKGQFATKFTYVSQSGGKWWWKISMDNSCLETLTAPTSVADLEQSHVEFIIRRHIFDLARQSGLRVEQSASGGGGHLSLDSETTFGGSVELFVESMRQWETGWASWVEHFGKEPREKDVSQAPWTGDLPTQDPSHLDRVTRLLDAVLNDAENGDVDLPGAIGRLQRLMVDLPLHARAGDNVREKVDANPEDRLHYQAVNLEHMASADTGARRVEFRDIQAQSGYDQLMADLTFIGRMLEEVRDEVRVSQRNRFAARHSTK
ncbi:hypothetical protein [Streptomyces sp. NPDC059783]|uniref:hypothetical protein n=1 Tax=Streptomyces sp. NPDC059783 TaxID=3346944 RepID=UPI00364A6E55